VSAKIVNKTEREVDRSDRDAALMREVVSGGARLAPSPHRCFP
jgi:hypothetical protein